MINTRNTYIHPAPFVRLWKLIKEGDPKRIWLKRDILRKVGIDNYRAERNLNILVSMDLIEIVETFYTYRGHTHRRATKGYKIKKWEN